MPAPPVRLSIVLPCLDEERTIGDVVAEARRGIAACGDDLADAEVIVADNGSADRSAEIARGAGARVVHAPIRGYGAALHWGIAHARSEYVLFGDSDLSYDFTLIPRFVAAVREGPCDLVLGTRLGGEIEAGAMPALHRRLGTPVLNLLIRLFTGLRTTDCNSGQRLVRREFYRGLRMRCRGMEWASELLLKTRLRRGVYREVPVRLRPDRRGRPPHLRPWRDGWRHLKSIVMLAPDRTVIAPSAALGVAGAAAIPARPDLAATALAVAWLGAIAGVGIKTVLHADGVRPSRTVALLLRSRTAEVGIGAAIAMFAAGVVLLLGDAAAARPLVGALLAVSGAATLLGVLLFETLRTHLVSDLDAAWERGGP